MKKIFCIILAVISIVSILVFSGCGSDTAVDSNKVQETAKVAGMEIICRASGFIYYRELMTDVVYLEDIGSSGKAITVLWDPETNGPLTYEKWTEYQNGEPISE